MLRLDFSDVGEFKAWFETHVSLGGKPYTLDNDQARAVLDNHKNTLVTARAGSGKTRVIVAKIAYLVASGQAKLSEIAAFMFNRTAAAEVNERIGAVMVDGCTLPEFSKFTKSRLSENNSQAIKSPVRVASTFHKFALDLVRISGERPEIISETEHGRIIRKSVENILEEQDFHPHPQEREEILRLVSSFIARAGQKYAGNCGLANLCADVKDYCRCHEDDAQYANAVRIHQIALSAYQDYLLTLNVPKIDFNILMSRATQILQVTRESAKYSTALANNAAQRRVAPLKFLLVDEYQDFSYLFFSLIQAIRGVCPEAHLFAVGDDWQAINRFAGSDVNYFINFAQYFPEDVINIPLMTNYRSHKRIVENANKYMLKNYNPKATKAVPFSKKNGKIIRVNLSKLKFDQSDLYEDGLGDAVYLQALAKVCGGAPQRYASAGKLLKSLVKIVKKHRKDEIMLLHRHNFTSCPGVTLENLCAALGDILVSQRIMSETTFSQKVRCMTMHKSKGLEANIVILLEVDRDIVLSPHPHATIFKLFGDTLEAEKADQHRLLYVALTRAKHKLYILSSDKKCPV